MIIRLFAAVFVLLASATLSVANETWTLQRFDLPAGHSPGQIALEPAGGGVWFTLPKQQAIGRLDPATGETRLLPLGQGAKPKAIVRLEDGRLIVFDAALDIAHEIEPTTSAILRRALPGDLGPLEISAATLGPDGAPWFAAYAGGFGRLDPSDASSQLWRAADGRGPAGVAAGDGALWLTSFIDQALFEVVAATGVETTHRLPEGQLGPKGVAVGADGRVWVAASTSGALLAFSPQSKAWMAFDMPYENAKPYAVTVAKDGAVLVTDIANDTVSRLDPRTEVIETITDLSNRSGAKSIATRGEEIWVAEGGADAITLVRRASQSQ